MKKHILLKKLSFITTLIVIGIVAATSLSPLNTVHAASTAGFNAGRIIDDTIFTNKDSMNASQIQAFLVSKVPVCDTWGTGGSTSTSRRDYIRSLGYDTPLTCLMNYTENGRTAAQIIYDTAQKYRINPQVFLVLLQKEQGLVTDDWPGPWQFRTATGYGCPDGAPCEQQYFGLTNQLDWSGKMFRAIMDNVPQEQWSTPYILGNNYIKWHPDFWNASTQKWEDRCGGTTVNIQNRATQALYNYTPYQPNQAALNAGYSDGDGCSAYGNRNFYLYFTDWFGPTLGPAYSWNMTNYSVYSDAAHTTQINNGGTINVTPGQTVFVHVTAQNNGGTTWQKNTLKIGTQNYTPLLRDSSWIWNDRAAYMNEDTVSYGQTATFDFKISAPQTYGSYKQNYNLVIDNVTWFNNAGPTLNFNVTSPLANSTESTVNQLQHGGQLTPGQTIYSANKNTALHFGDGRVALYVNTACVWSTPASSKAARFVNQDDGNLVLYGSDGSVIWASNTNIGQYMTLHVQNDGNLVLYNPNNATVWSSHTVVNNSNMQVNNNLTSDQTIFRGQQLTTPDRKYTFILQDDGNLVLYSQLKPLWATNTEGSKAVRLTLQGDGNLVLYTDSSRPLWASNTEGRPNSYFTLQDDHNMVIYSPAGSPIWASNTNGK